MPAAAPASEYHFAQLKGGIDFAADALPERKSVAIHIRLLNGVALDPPELTGLAGIVERTLSKGTQNFDGRGLADAFDAIGAQWSTATGRQSTLIRAVCLPEFVDRTVELLAEMVCRPTFPEDACRVAVQLAEEELKHLEDDPYELLRVLIQRITLGPVLGRDPRGEAATLGRITPDAVRAHWRRTYHSGCMQIAVAGPVDAEALAARFAAGFATLGDPTPAGREPVAVRLEACRSHRDKDLKQQYIGLSLPGAPRGTVDFPTEQVLLGVLSGGMSGRLFTEVREKQGLVYWVGAWHEQPRGMGVIHLGASTTPERCEQTYRTLLRELERIAEDLSEDETRRARDQLIAHYETEDDLTRARASGLSDDLFHFGRPIGLSPKLEAIRRVTMQDVERYARCLERERLCVATIGPKPLA